VEIGEDHTNGDSRSIGGEDSISTETEEIEEKGLSVPYIHSDPRLKIMET
jgi:hypothetical protein